MQFFKSLKSLYALIVFLSFTLSIHAQSKMEYGVGIGLLYGDYHESSNLPAGFEFDIDKAKLSPSVNAYVAYRMTEKTKLTTSPGINFLLHHEPFSSRNLSAVYFHLPLGIQYKVLGNLSVMGDLFYDYLVNQSYEFQSESISVTELADARHLYGGSLGVAYSVGRYVEIQLTANHQFNPVNTFTLTDLDGDPLGNVKLKNRFLKLNLVFRG